MDINTYSLLYIRYYCVIKTECDDLQNTESMKIAQAHHCIQMRVETLPNNEEIEYKPDPETLPPSLGPNSFRRD